MKVYSIFKNMFLRLLGRSGVMKVGDLVKNLGIRGGCVGTIIRLDDDGGGYTIYKVQWSDGERTFRYEDQLELLNKNR
jgi:hypothetical protein